MAVETATFQLVMPAMGDSVAEGTVLEWHKQEGDLVVADETIVEISTDKVDAEVPAPVAGRTLVKIHAAEGDTVRVGALLAEIATNGAGAAAATAWSRRPPRRRPRRRCPAPHDRRHRHADRRRVGHRGHDPRVVGEGRRHVARTATRSSRSRPTRSTWSCPRPRQRHDHRDPVPGGRDRHRRPGDRADAHRRRGVRCAGAPAGDGACAAPSPTSAPAGTAPPSAGAGASPVAQRVAAAEGVDLGRVERQRPRGPDHEVRRARRRHRNGAAAVAARPAGTTRIKGGAAVLARYMDESRSIPTATSFRTLTVTTLDARRKQLKDAGQRVSFTHLIAYAIARAATDDMPVMAHHFLELDGVPHRVDDGAVNLGLAVDVEKKDGTRTLMVPVIRDAGRLSFGGFLDAYDDARREGPDEHAHRRRADRRRTSRSPTPAASARSPRCRG